MVVVNTTDGMDGEVRNHTSMTNQAESDAIKFQWTTGAQEGVIHQKLVDTGGFSEVHQEWHLNQRR